MNCEVVDRCVAGVVVDEGDRETEKPPKYASARPKAFLCGNAAFQSSELRGPEPPLRLQLFRLTK